MVKPRPNDARLPIIAEWTHDLVYDETATAQYKSGKRDVGNYGGGWLNCVSLAPSRRITTVKQQRPER